MEIAYEDDITLSVEEEDALFKRVLFFLSQKVKCAVVTSEIISFDDISWNYEGEESGYEEVIDVKNLTSCTPLVKLYTQALQADDLEIRFLYFYKIIEHISPMVAKMNAYDKLNKRLDLLWSCERDSKYLDSIFDICRKYDEDVKDDFLCISVIHTCVDVVPLWNLLPQNKKNLYNGNLKLNIKEPIRDTSFSEEKINSFQKQLASSLYATRNSIVHAKSNFSATGTEFSLDEMEEANKLMEIIASSIIQWNERQPEIYKIKESEA